MIKTIIILTIACIFCINSHVQNPEGKINFLIQVDDTVTVLSHEKDTANSSNQYAVLKDENLNLKVVSTVTMVNKDTKDSITKVYPFLSERETWTDRSWMENRSDTVHRHFNELQTWSGMHLYTLHITHKKDTMVVNFDNPGTHNIDLIIHFQPGNFTFKLKDLVNGGNEVVKTGGSIMKFYEVEK